MTEQLIKSIKDRLYHVIKDQGFNLQRNLSIAVIACWMVPHRAFGSSPFVMIYSCEAIAPHEIPLTRHALEEKYQNNLKSHIFKMFEPH